MRLSENAHVRIHALGGASDGKHGLQFSADRWVRPGVEMTDQEAIEIEGVVIETLPNAMFRVELQNGHRVLAHVPGESRTHFIKILPGDTVSVELSPYDLATARIVVREAG